jgi:NhaP-type Na+/H+ or K+/H+ antiporter
MILISAGIGLIALYRVLVSKRLSKARRSLLSIVLVLAIATSWVSIIAVPVVLVLSIAAFYLGRGLSPTDPSPSSGPGSGD